jgi:hypothetical protein
MRSARQIAPVLCLCVSLACLARHAEAEDLIGCMTIKAEKQRLACYDKAAKALVEEQARAQQERLKAAQEQVVRASNPNALSDAQKEAAKQAIKQLNKLTAATEVGISYRDYGTRIVDMSPDFKEAIGGIPKSELRDYLSDALTDHVRAREIWSAMIQVEYGDIFEKAFCPDLRKQYPEMSCSATTQYSAGGRVARIDDESKNRILRGIWSAAKVRIGKAEALLAAGKLNADTPVPAPAAPAETEEQRKYREDVEQHRKVLKEWEENQRK